MLFWRVCSLTCWIFNIKASCREKVCEKENIQFISPPHTALGHTQTRQQTHTRPHTLHVRASFISSYRLLLRYPDWTTPNNRHRLYSSSALFKPPLLLLPPRSLLPYPTNKPPLENPASVVQCLPFISFHLSGLLKSTTGIKAGGFNGAATPPQKSIFTSLHISVLTNGWLFQGCDTMNRIICSYCTDVSVASCGTREHLKCSLTSSCFLEVSAENWEASMC